MESSSTPGAAPADGPDLVFLSRDGRIRTDDLSVPKSPGVDRSGLVRTKTAGQSNSRTAVDCCERWRTRDGRAMESKAHDMPHAHWVFASSPPNVD